MIKRILTFLFAAFLFLSPALNAENMSETSAETDNKTLFAGMEDYVFDIKSPQFYDKLTTIFNKINISGSGQDNILSLKKSLETAEKKSMTLAIARSKTEEAYYKIDEVKSNKNIIVGVNGTATYSGPVQTIEFDGNSMSLGSSKNWSSALTARYLITNFGLLEDAKCATWLNYLNAKLGEEKELQELYSSIITSYLGTLETTGLYVVAASSIELRKRQMEIAKIKYEEGVSPKYDLLTARVNLKSAEQIFISATRAMELNKSALRNKMGVEQNVDFQIIRPVYLKFEDISLENAIDMAYQNRIELAQMDMTVDLAKKGFDISAQGKNPALLLNGSFSLQSVGFGRSPYSWSTALVLDIPIFDGGAAKAKMNQSKELIKQTEYLREQLRRDIALQVNDALLRSSESYKKFQAAQANLDLAQEAYEIAFIRYKESVGTFLELDAATVSYMAALAEVSSAYCEYERSQLNLFYSTGLLVKEVKNNVLLQNN